MGDSEVSSTDSKNFMKNLFPEHCCKFWKLISITANVHWTGTQMQKHPRRAWNICATWNMRFGYGIVAVMRYMQ